MDVQVSDNFHLVCEAFDRDIHFTSLTSAISFLNSWNQPDVSMMLFKVGSHKTFIVKYTNDNQWVVSSLGFNNLEVAAFQILLTGG